MNPLSSEMSSRRTKEQILDALKDFIEKQQQEGKYEFFKSDVVDSNSKVHPDTTEEFFRLIEKAQKEFPPIEVREIGGTTLIRVLTKSEIIIQAIDKLIGEGQLSKEAIAELVEFRTHLQEKSSSSISK